MSGTALDVLLEPRLGPRKSARRQRVTIGSDVPVWFDVRDDQTGALVPGATGVAALYWLPGTVEDESAAQPLTAVETTPGTWQVVVPASVPGTYTVWLSIATPIVQTAEAIFDVSSIGQVTLTSTGTPDWGQVQAVAAAAAVSAALPEAQRAGTKAGADAAKPFADDAAASEAIALDAADLARTDRIAAQSARGAAETARDTAQQAANTTSAKVAEAEQAAANATAALSLTDSYDTRVDIEAKKGDYAENKSVQVIGDPNPALNGIWTKRSGAWVQTSSLTIAAVGTRLAATQNRVKSVIDLPPINVGGRMLQPTRVNKDRTVLDGVWTDTGEPFRPSASVAQVQAVETRTGGIRQLPAITVNGRPFQPLTVAVPSRRVLRGFYADTGEAFPPVAGGISSLRPEMVAQVVSATEIRLHAKGQVANSGKYVTFIIKNLAQPAKNSDVWRVHYVHESTLGNDGNFSFGQEIFIEGEQEFAVRPQGCANFIGGNNHGNEERTSFYALADGIPITIAAGMRYECRRFEMFQSSQGWLPGSTTETTWLPKGPKVLDLWRRWEFSRDDAAVSWVLTNRLEFKAELKFGGADAPAYIAMACVARTHSNGALISTTAAREPYWQPEDVSQDGFAQIDTQASAAKLWGPVGYALEMRWLKGWDQPLRHFYVSNRTGMNKAYWNGIGGTTAAPVTMAAGTVMEVAVEYLLTTRN
jgi:hypothetical protein